MVKRLLTAFLGLIIFFAVMLSHRFVVYIAVTFVSLLMLYEMFRAMKVGKALQVIGLISGVLVCGGAIVNRPVLAVFIAVFLFLLALVFMYGKENSQKTLSVGFVSIVIPFLFSILFSMVKYCNKYIMFLPFICAWMSDSGAYIFGSLLGKHKLCEELSPKKTVEGAVFGILFSIIGCVAFDILIVKLCTDAGMPSIHAMIKFAWIGLVGGAASQIGDLAASAIKRDYDIKDFGNLLPGHGGVMDRFDSVLIAIPVVYYALMYYLI